MKKTVFYVAFPILVLFLLALAFQSHAQQGTPQTGAPKAGATQSPPAGTSGSSGAQTGKPDGSAQEGHEGMMQKCKEMKAAHEKFAADLKAMDAKLEEKLAAMNTAKGDQKVTAMGEVINELVSQRKEIHSRMTAMHGCGMCPMMQQHAGEGRQGGMAMGCPMMKQMHQGQGRDHGQGHDRDHAHGAHGDAAKPEASPKQ